MTSSDIDETEMERRLARAEAAVAELAENYAVWALADVDKCAEWLQAARAASGEADRAAAMEALHGTAHNIKGQGSSFGYPLMTGLGASLCRLARNRPAPSAAEFDLAASHLAAMRLVLAQKIKGDGGALGSKLVERLKTLVDEAVPPQPPDEGSDLIR